MVVVVILCDVVVKALSHQLAVERIHEYRHRLPAQLCGLADTGAVIDRTTIPKGNRCCMQHKNRVEKWSNLMEAQAALQAEQRKTAQAVEEILTLLKGMAADGAAASTNRSGDAKPTRLFWPLGNSGSPSSAAGMDA